MKGKRCTYQVFDVKHVCNKYRAKGKYVFYGFMDLMKSYAIDKRGMWQMLRMCVVGAKMYYVRR